ncbi:hypothetical protein [Methylorubrum zatmanii]|uniref:Uncharacterized protein n=1 Tax=Methylorubrum zatmanii TaxID=29429 RepID=A0ABW1WLX2_9HYPH|nr:hypothetical protein [Methylorubrum zatmanii]
MANEARSLPIIPPAQSQPKPAIFGQSQIRMIEKFKLFSNLAIEPASGNS